MKPNASTISRHSLSFPPSGNQATMSIKVAKKRKSRRSEPAGISSQSLRELLVRYHSLAAAHCRAVRAKKKQRLSEGVTAQQQRVRNWMTLYRMAQETLDFCGSMLKTEEELLGRSMKANLDSGDGQTDMMPEGNNRDDVEELWKKAMEEKKVAEKFFNLYFGQETDDDAENSMASTSKHSHDTLHERTIGRIPVKFLDLTHFPNLQSKAAVMTPFHDKNDHSDCNDTHVIDCTDEYLTNTNSSLLQHRHHQHRPIDTSNTYSSSSTAPIINPTDEGHPSRNYFNGIIAVENSSVTASHNHAQKQIFNRINISQAPLAHVNGTYIQEGTYNSAPLFVRVGPPRKFMGKWDCRVVLRRERRNSDGDDDDEEHGQHPQMQQRAHREVNKAYSHQYKGLVTRGNCHEGGEGGYIWKIGLVPSHNTSHPRIIGYYYAEENDNGISSSDVGMDNDNDDEMEEDDDVFAKSIGVTHLDNREIMCLSPRKARSEVMYSQPSAGGWKVVQQAVAVAGRVTSLRISFEK